MTNTKVTITGVVNSVLVILVLFTFFSCSHPKDVFLNSDFVLSYTSTLNSRKDNIKIIFREKINPLLEGNVYVGGKLAKASLLDDYTMQIAPGFDLENGKSYMVNIKRAVFSNSIMQEDGDMKFTIKTPPQDLSIKDGRFYNYDKSKPELLKYEGRMDFRDYISKEEVVNNFSAKYGIKAMKVDIEGAPDSNKAFYFYISGIEKKSGKSSLKLFFKNKNLSYSKEISILSAFDFKVQSYELKDYKTLLISFTKPLKDQELSGLIRTKPEMNLDFKIDSNEVTVLAKDDFPDRFNLIVDGLTSSVDGFFLKNNLDLLILKDEEKPSIKFLAPDKNIITSEQNYNIRFKTINVKSVTLKVLHIKDANALHFLQLNQIGTPGELERNGEVVFLKKFNLNYDSESKNRWIEHSIDLKELHNKYKNGIYNVSVGFKVEDIDYQGSSAEKNAVNDRVWVDFLKREENEKNNASSSPYFEAYSLGVGYFTGDYNFRERDNPLHPAYYSQFDKTIARMNFLISDIGLSAFKDDYGNLKIYSSDLISAKLKNGVRVSIYNYQNRLLGEAESKNGISEFNLQGEKPFLVIAKYQDQSSYLKLNSENLIDLSGFDIGGRMIAHSLDGYIFSDRGIYSPGDEAYISFVYLDKNNRIPKEHPVNFSLYSPRGILIEKKTLEDSFSGFFVLKFKIPEESELGDFNFEAEIGGNTFKKNIRVDRIIANRIEIKLDLVNGKTYQNPLKIGLLGSFFSGGKVGGLKANISGYFSPTKTLFQGYKNYNFDYILQDKDSFNLNIFDGVLDENGAAKIEFKRENRMPGMMNLRLESKVFESNGGFSINETNVKFSPYSSYVGLQIANNLKTETENSIQVVDLTQDGKKIAGAKVKISFYKIGSTWWEYENKELNEQYMKDNALKPIKEDIISLANGEGEYKLKLDKHDFGTYIVMALDLQSGHMSAQRVFVYDFYGDVTENKGGFYNLQISSNKSEYKIGDVALFSAKLLSDQGSCLSVKESYGRIIGENWIDVADGRFVEKIKIQKDMFPNFYLHVSCFTKENKSGENVPIRMFATLPISVKDDYKKLSPYASLKDAYEPGEEVEFEVKESSGRPMTYSISIVDEGILNVSNYKSPEPFSYFYQKISAVVQKFDIYDEFQTPYKNAYNTNLKVGGGFSEQRAMLAEITPFLAVNNVYSNNNTANSIVLGPFYLNAGEKKIHKVKLENSFGIKRFMIVAKDNDNFGSFEKKFELQSNLMAFLNAKNSIALGDIIELPLKIISKDLNTEAKVSSSGKLEVLSVSRMDTSGFIIKMLAKEVGSDVLNIVVSSSKLNKVVNLKKELNVVYPTLPINKSKSFSIQAGQSNSYSDKFLGYKNTNSLFITPSTFPSLYIKKYLDEIDSYSYANLNSVVFFGLSKIGVEKLIKTDEKYKDKIKRDVEYSLETLKKYRSKNGGLSYYPLSSFQEPFSNSFTFLFLSNAKNAGFAIDEDMYLGLSEYLKKTAQDFENYSSKEYVEAQAFRLYVLAKAFLWDLPSMNRLNMRKNDSYNKNVVLMLANSYYLAGYREVAKEIIKTLNYTVKDAQESVLYASLFLENLEEMGADVLTKSEVLREISSYLGNFDIKYEDFAFFISILSKMNFFTGEKPVVEYQFEKEKKTSSEPFTLFESDFKSPNFIVYFKNLAQSTLFLDTVLTYIPNLENEVSESSKINLKTVLQNGFKSVSLGENVSVKIEVSNTFKDDNTLVLEVPFAAGLSVSKNGVTENKYDYIDFKDKSILVYFSMKADERRDFNFNFYASFAGEFYMGGPRAFSLKNRDVHASLRGYKLKIEK